MLSCRFENQNDEYRFRHVTVDALMFNHEKQLCLVKRSDSSIEEPSMYSFPGGFLELNETTIEGVLREVHEETGYKAEVKRLFRINDDPSMAGNPNQNIEFFFIVEALNQIGQHDEEIDSVHWFDLNALPNKDDIAFNHADVIDQYTEYLQKPFDLPLFG
ncbi:NUDIX hydrolase [candidate division WWE3 bacterium]|uniref:NUDIX hydrolase n=1 Tax=candidate division WWE3 bacterium TaxID=2053526 RepID=A0A955LKQ7_UNCKA|nr:NUDIX hydrolase [candidate division WWE3 bacterium]